MTAAVESPAPRARFIRFLQAGWPVAAVVLLTIYFFAPATNVLDVTLDSSNYGSYSLFTAQGRQYGTEVIPMAGPYGFVVYGTTYAGNLYWDRVALELLIKAAFALLVVGFLRDSASRVARWIWLAAILVILPGAELVYDFTILFAGLYLVLNYQRPGRLLLSCAAAALLGLLALTKGTMLVFAVATIGLVGLQAVIVREFRRLAALAGAFAAALLGCWLAAGQDPRHLPAFVHGINELSSGYNGTMGLQEPALPFATGAGSLALLGLVLAGLGWAQRRRLGVLSAVLLLGAFSFMKWKHGFVRADGHIYLFYHFATIGTLTAWLLGRNSAADLAAPARGWRWLLAAGTFAGTALAYYGPGPNPLAFLAWQAGLAAPRLPANLASLASLAAAKRELGPLLEENRATFALPLVQATVGRASIDFFGIEHGYLPLNRLNYQPRPMSGGTFNVFTPYLQRRNADFIADPRTRPAFYLLNLQTIDNRLLAQDDGSALRAIVQGYTPVAAEQGMILLQARPDARPASAPQLLASRAFRFGETVPVPAAPAGSMVLAAFDFPPSLRGRLRAALYKPSELYVSLEGDNLQEPESRRLVPSLSSLPLILSPLLENTSDVLALYSADPGKVVRAFHVNAQLPDCFAAEGVRVTFYSAPRPAPIDAARRRELSAPLIHPMANRVPIAIEPPFPPFRLPNGLLVDQFNAPARLVFALDGTERVFAYDYGLNPECYQRGKTDGVEFFVELQQPEGPVQVIHRHYLRPLTVPADRGRHQARLVLPPIIRPGSRLIVRGDPGPNGDNGWDWAYVAKMRFESGPPRAEQFPGFNRVPAELAGDYCGAIGGPDGHPIFMLNAVGHVGFVLDGREQSLRFGGGFLEGAYTQGDTDGAEFVVELTTADGRTTELLRRWLRPKTVIADRGLQAFAVSLPAHAAGDRLKLSILGGPAGNIAWDWTYLDGLDLR